MKIKYLLLLLLLGATTFAAATENRKHYLVASRDNRPAYEITRIFSQDSLASRTTFLVADPSGPLLRLELVNDYANRQNVATYTLLRASRAKAKVVIDLPFASTTREGRRDELRKRPELATAPVPVTIHGSGKTIHGLDSDWRQRDSREGAHRKSVRDAVDEDLIASLETIREIAGLPPFAEINATLGYVVDPSLLIYRSKRLMVATVKPDCVFDAKFGVPCKH